MDPDLLSLRDAIASKTSRTFVFFRDDDGGWANEQLALLCDVMMHYRVPLDIAMIPSEATIATRAVIERYGVANPGLLGVHQHGFAHENHEAHDRNCEFGSARTFAQQIRDIEQGRVRLQALFGESLQPIFTPPWNRCVQATVDALTQLRFVGLSRIHGSSELATFDLRSLDVAIDWQKRKLGKRLSWSEFCLYAQKQFLSNDQVGVMLHHEHMDARERAQLRRFIEMLLTLPQVQMCSMAQLQKEHLHA